MVAEKIFWKDPYLTKLKAIVTSANCGRITLDKTIFYAFAGGQESDAGTIAGFKVIEARKYMNDIVYTLEPKANLKIGDEVIVKIDWEKRYKIMRLHFAAEIILELVCQNYNHPEKIGANITSEKARLDFRWDGNIAEILPGLMEKATEIINADLSIVSGFSDEKNERRYWSIENFAKVDCGGTHIKRTGEIGGIVLKRKSLGSGKERIEICLML